MEGGSADKEDERATFSESEDEDEVEDLEPEDTKWLDLEPEEDGTLRMPDRPLAPTGLPHFRK